MLAEIRTCLPCAAVAILLTTLRAIRMNQPQGKGRARAAWPRGAGASRSLRTDGRALAFRGGGVHGGVQPKGSVEDCLAGGHPEAVVPAPALQSPTVDAKDGAGRLGELFGPTVDRTGANFGYSTRSEDSAGVGSRKIPPHPALRNVESSSGGVNATST